MSGIAAAVRPSCIPVILVPMFALWLHNYPQTTVKLLWTVTGAALWALPLLSDRAVSKRVHGKQVSSLAGRHIYAKASLIDAEEHNRVGFTPLEHRVADLMERDFAPIRDRLRGIEDPEVFDIVRFNYEVCIQYSCSQELLRAVRVPRAELDRAMLKVGWKRLRRRPRIAIALAWDEYRGLWTLHPGKASASAAVYNRFLASSPPLPYAGYLGTEGRPVPQDEQKAVYGLNRLIFRLLAFLVPLFGIKAMIAYARREASADGHNDDRGCCRVSGDIGVLRFVRGRHCALYAWHVARDHAGIDLSGLGHTHGATSDLRADSGPRPTSH